MHPQFLAASVSDAGDGVAGTAEADETFCVDVQQITGARPLVQPYLLARLARAPGDPRTAERPPDRRVGMAGLARDQSRAPAAAKARRADSLLLADRKQPGTAMRPRGAILETSIQRAILRARFAPATPPFTRSRRRNATTPCRFTTRRASLDVSHERATSGKSETSITVKSHPGPPSTASLARPTASKETRMTYLAVHNLSRHVI